MGKKFAVTSMLSLAGLVFVLGMGVASAAWAVAWDDPSEKMAMKLFCQLFSVLSGDFGLLIGFAAAAYGLYLMLTKGVQAGWVLLVGGALLTALPGVIATSLTGVGNVMLAAGISPYGNGPMSAALDYVNTCSTIVVDLAPYDDTNAAYNAPGGGAALGHWGGNGNLMGASGSGAGNMANGSTPRGALGPAIPSAGCSADPSPQCVTARDGGQRLGKMMVPSNGRVNSCLGRRQCPGGQRCNPEHKGMDLSCGGNASAPIFAQRPGTVRAVGDGACGGGYGTCVCLDVGGDVDCYMHLSSTAASAKLSGSVGGNTQIGFCGNTGGGGMPVHLHYEIQRPGFAPCNRVDPITVVGG